MAMKHIGRAIAVLWSLAAIAASCTPSLDFDSVSAGGPKDAGKTPGKDSGPSGDDDDDTSETGSNDAPTGTGCDALAAPVTFCDDFDHESLDVKWDSPSQENGVINADSITYLTAPNALLAKTESVTSTGSANAFVPKAFTLFDGKPISLDVQFDMRVEAFDTNASGGNNVMIAFAVLFGPDDSYNQLVLNLKGNGSTGVVAQLVENAIGPGENDNGYQLHGPFSARPKVNGWTHVHIAFTVSSPVGKTGNLVTLDFDGVKQLDNVSLSVPLKGGTPRIELGVSYVTPPSMPWSIRYDNFVADLHVIGQ